MWGVTGCTGYIVEETLIIILLRVTGCAAVAMPMIRRTGRSMDDAPTGCRSSSAVCRVRARVGAVLSLVSHYCLFGLFIEHCVAPVCACGPTA